MTIQSITWEGARRTGDDVSTAIIETVADAAGVEPTALPPLYERVDPDALEALFAPTSVGMPRSGTIDFSYHDYAITVSCGDATTITLEERILE